ncbi:aminoglycoside phosphotransferase family protein [Ktedonospora formicarum]|uniref:Streptomycin 6-kinase n=1 Tax=Ktedonospora formicarum TaxID=2778364 RepID=A0A8J3MV28_9CHLR|nr:aminoglycoside phosphotransferase family protein [Ktedonospora formicarum]GHO49932.1 streptomycin 6-kinase [Ktedonospora formicarum]
MFHLPEDFLHFMREVYGTEAANAWFQCLPSLLEEYAQRWQLTLLSPFENLSLHYVAPAICADGTPVILKTSAFSDEFEHGLAALRIFNGRGIARLLECDEEKKVMVLERLQPGTMLESLVPEQDVQATSILAGIMRQLWRPVPREHTFPTVEQLGQDLTQLRASYAGGYGPFPPRLVDEAMDLFATLSASAPQTMLLHGDLHHYNILRSGDTWLAIDPKGVVGDPGYEVAASLFNPLPRILLVPDLEQMLARRVAQLSEELGMERARIRGWGLAQSVRNAWSMMSHNQLSMNPQGVLRCAEILSRLTV